TRSAIATIQAVREEIERIRASEVTEEELKTARDAVLNHLAFAFDSKAKVFDFLLNLEYYGYPKDFVPQLQKGLMAVTRADVLRAAKAHLDPGRLAVLVVGSPDDFAEPLTALGPVTPIPLTIAPPKAETVKAVPSSLERGKQLLDRAQRAMGGVERLAAVRDMIQVTEYQFVGVTGGSARETDR